MSVSLKTPLVIENDRDLMRVAGENPGYSFEREANGSVVVSPTNTKGGAKSAEACGQLRDYKKRFGGNVFDSNTGFAIRARDNASIPRMLLGFHKTASMR